MVVHRGGKGGKKKKKNCNSIGAADSRTPQASQGTRAHWRSGQDPPNASALRRSPDHVGTVPIFLPHVGCSGALSRDQRGREGGEGGSAATRREDMCDGTPAKLHP